MSRRVGFVSIFAKTQLFHSMAEGFAQAGYEPHWFAPSRKWAAWIRSRWGDDAVTRMPASKRTTVTSGDEALLAEISHALDAPAHRIVLADRLEANRPLAQGLCRLVDYYRAVAEELEQGDWAGVVLEPTFLPDLAAVSACRETGIPVLHPHTVRLPSGRVGVFSAPWQRTLLELPGCDDELEEGGTHGESGRRLDYMRPELFSTSPALWWLTRAASKTRDLVWEQGHDGTLATFLEFLTQRSPVIRMRRAQTLRSYLDAHAAPSVAPEKLSLLFTLHRQPEQSIDWLAWRYSDQVETVRRVANELPEGWELVVKEHPIGIGDRTVATLERIRALPGVRLIDPTVATSQLLGEVDGAVTATGTVAYESGLRLLPALTLQNMFFSGLPSVVSAEEIGSLEQSVGQLIEMAEAALERQVGSERDSHRTRGFVERVQRNSFEVELYDPVTFRSSGTVPNASRLQAFGRVIGEALDPKPRWWQAYKGGPDATA